MNEYTLKNLFHKKFKTIEKCIPREWRGALSLYKKEFLFKLDDYTRTYSPVLAPYRFLLNYFRITIPRAQEIPD